MTILEISFWILIGIILYAYLAYGALVIGLGWIKNFLREKANVIAPAYSPSVTLLIAAYNEETWLEMKIENSLSLDYPEDKLKIMVITDGSNDGSAEIAGVDPRIVHLHENTRRGKSAAINRAMKFVDSEIVIFTDANALLNREAVRALVSGFEDSAVGCVCGEKRVCMESRGTAASAGESMYWRYESLIKKWEARLGSCMGAAGELFAIRTRLFTNVPDDTLLDDFVISLRLALKGYRVQYVPGAYAIEEPSANLHEEFKRKIRIAAGNLQTILRLPELLNPFRHGLLAFQYISHKFLRSFVVPVCMIVLIPLNLLLLRTGEILYIFLVILQAIFYLFAGAGFLLQKSRLSFKFFFLPMYVTLMNLSALTGVFRYLGGWQSVLWEKAARHIAPESEEGR